MTTPNAVASDRAADPGRSGAAVWSTRVALTFDGLAAEWADLERRAVAGPFQSYAWLTAWTEAYARPGSLRLVLVRRDGELVAAAPLRLARRGGVRVLAPVGGDQSDYHDVLLDQAVPEAARRLAAALRALPGWDVLDLADVPAGAAAERLALVWPGRRWRSSGAMCLELPVGTVPEFVGRLPKHSAKTAKRKLRKIEQAAVVSRPVPAAEVPAAVDRLLTLHAGQWQGRTISAEHLRPRFRRHLAAAAAGLAEEDRAVVTEYTVDGRVAVVDVALVGPGYLGTYLAGYDPALRERVDVATLMLTRVLGETERRGFGTVRLLRGDEPYKSQWRPDPHRNARLLLGRTAAAPGYAAAVRGRRRAADELKERWPRLRETRLRVRSALGRRG